MVTAADTANTGCLPLQKVYSFPVYCALDMTIAKVVVCIELMQGMEIWVRRREIERKKDDEMEWGGGGGGLDRERENEELCKIIRR